MSFGCWLRAAEDKHIKRRGAEHECYGEWRCTRMSFLQNCSLLLASSITSFCAVSCCSICNPCHVCYIMSFMAHTFIRRSTRNPTHARALTKPDESMNPYESTMNQIQKTDESMNPSLLYRSEKGFFIFIRYNGFMDSSVF